MVVVVSGGRVGVVVVVSGGCFQYRTVSVY